MIWFFLMGMLAGAGCVVLFIHRFVKKHTTVIRVNEEEMEEKTHE